MRHSRVSTSILTFDILISSSRKRTRISKQVDKADGNVSVNIQDENIFLCCGQTLDGEGIIEEGVAGEVLLDVFFDKLDTQVWVVHRLDLMANTTAVEERGRC
jgi:hypothetical protein